MINDYVPPQLQAGQFHRLSEYEQGLQAMQRAQQVPKNVGELKSWMPKAASYPSTPYQKLFKQLLESELAPSAFDRIMRLTTLHNPGKKHPTQAMNDAIAKMNVSPTTAHDLRDLLRHPPSPGMRAAQSYVQSGINPLFPALRSSPTAVSGASRQKQIPSSLWGCC